MEPPTGNHLGDEGAEELASALSPSSGVGQFNTGLTDLTVWRAGVNLHGAQASPPPKSPQLVE